MTVAEQLGRNLKRIRRRAGMSQDDLSLRSGLHHAEISLLERGGRIPRLDTAIRIIGCTEGDPRDLLEGIAWHEPPDRRENGWFTIVGVQGAADLRLPRRGREDR